MSRVTRIEVIDENGRSYVNRHPDNEVNVEYQDEGATMKIFVTRKKKDVTGIPEFDKPMVSAIPEYCKLEE